MNYVLTTQLHSIKHTEFTIGSKDEQCIVFVVLKFNKQSILLTLLYYVEAVKCTYIGLGSLYVCLFLYAGVDGTGLHAHTM